MNSGTHRINSQDSYESETEKSILSGDGAFNSNQIRKKDFLNQSIPKIFSYFISLYVNKFLPSIQSKLTNALGEEDATELIETFVNLFDNIKSMIIMEPIPNHLMSDPSYAAAESIYPAIYFYSSENEPESKLFRHYMVPGDFKKTEIDLQFRRFAYDVLDFELKMVARLHPKDFVFTEGNLYRFEWWDKGKIDCFTSIVETEDILNRDYSECSTFFSTSTSATVAKRFKKKQKENAGCFIRYEVVKLDDNLLAEYQHLFSSIDTKNNCFNISKFSYFPNEKEILCRDAMLKKIVSIHRKDPGFHMTAEIIIVNACLSDKVNLEFIENCLFAEICNLAVFDHLAGKKDPSVVAFYKQRAHDKRHFLQRYFQQVNKQLERTMIISDSPISESRRKRLISLQIWNKFHFYDHIIKLELDDTSCPSILHRILHNSDILLSKCQPLLQEMISPIIKQLIESLIQFIKHRDSDFMKRVLMECYRNLRCEVIDMHCDIDVEEFLTNVGDCLMFCTEKCVIDMEAGKFESIDDVILKFENKFQTFPYLSQFMSNIYHNFMSSNSYNTPPVEKDPITDQLIQIGFPDLLRNSTLILPVIKNGALKKFPHPDIPEMETKSNCTISREVICSTRKQITKFWGTIFNKTMLFKLNYLRNRVGRQLMSDSDDEPQEMPQLLNKILTSQKYPQWNDVMFTLDGRDYRKYVNISLLVDADFDVEWKIYQLTLALFASALYNLDLKSDWGQFQYLVGEK